MNKIIKVFVFSFVLSVLGASYVYAAGPAVVNLGTAGNFIVMSKTAISTTGATAITGDIGVSPAAATFMTGFSQTMNVSNKYSTSTYVTGKMYAADYAVPTPAYMSTAVSDMQAAYVDAAGRALPDSTNFNAGNLGSQSLVPGLYKFTTGVTIPANLTLTGGPSDVYIFQIAGNLDISSATSILLPGGALPSNIFWAVAGTTTLNTTSVFQGIILAGPGTSTVAMNTGSTLHGRILGQKNVSLDAAIINGVAGGVNPHITVTKVVINDNGRSNVVSDFPLFVGGTLVSSGVSNSFVPGDYVISETSNPNYTSSFSGDCDANGNITLYAGIDMSCTITNNDTAIPSSGGSTGGGTTYGCKDPSATNYNAFSSSNPALCMYGGSATTTTVNPVTTVTTTTTTTPVTIPKLPKTGFSPETWYGFLLNSFLNLFR